MGNKKNVALETEQFLPSTSVTPGNSLSLSFLLAGLYNEEAVV